MKKYVFYLSLILIYSFNSCNSINCEEGEGDFVAIQKEIVNFSDLKVSGDFEIILKQSNKISCTIETYENLHKFVEVRNSGRALEIKLKKCISSNKKNKVFINAPQIELIDVSGSSLVKSDGIYKFKDLEIEGSGASNINMFLDADKLDMDLSGSSEVYLKGTASDLTFEVSGSGQLNAFDLKTLNADVKISGAGDCNVNVRNKLYARVSGAGNVKYRGNPENIDSKVSGAGSISKSNI